MTSLLRLGEMLILLAFLCACGGGEKAPDAAVMSRGKGVYTTHCLSCHQADGYGVPNLNPPLAETDWVSGDKVRLIGVLLNGLEGAVDIEGETYNNAMASHSFLSDADIAAVLSFIRNSFGNEASAVSAEEVRAQRP